MSFSSTTPAQDSAAEDRVILGLSKAQRFRLYTWAVLGIVVFFLLWSLFFLQPHRWYTYTDQVSFQQVARDVDVGYVLWEPAEPLTGGLEKGTAASNPVVSSDGSRMIYSTGEEEGNANLFLREWDGVHWSDPRPMLALNSAFHELGPTLSGDAELLYFSSDRPGGRGGFDVWVARWDGAEYAWPLPLTGRVNTAFDEVDPSLAPDQSTLYFASNRPRVVVGESTLTTELLENVEKQKIPFDLYSADIATETGVDLIVERQLSMLYSLREGALADPRVMQKLGGTPQTEKAVDRGLEYLASTQEEDGRWSINKHGGRRGHDVAATAFALLAFFGRGEVHNEKCTYQDTVARGIQWMIDQQNGATGDLRGLRPEHNAMYDHGIASLAMVEAYGVTKDPALKPRAQAAIDFIAESQDPEGGGWRYQPKERGDLSVTGWMIMAMASAEMSGIRVPKKTMEGARKFLHFVSSGNHRGAYGYTGPGGGSEAMNAAGFFCAQLLGHSPNSHKAFESSHILNRQGFKMQDIYYAYYGTVAAYQHQGPGWRHWLKVMQPQFLRAQSKDGSWHFRGGHSNGMGKVICTALVTLCLEAHYRYTPLYGLGWEPPEGTPSGNSKDLAELAKTPLFRHAKLLESLSSPRDDRGPAVTDHGDFLYFSSTRDGGRGGADIYRTRISGDEPTAPQNLGEEINSEANETNPALRHAGFHLIFNSDREGGELALFNARSKRMVRRSSIFNLPSIGWIAGNFLWILGLVGGALGFFWLSKRAVAVGRLAQMPPPPPDDE